jgi:hypothetical protein
MTLFPTVEDLTKDDTIRAQARHIEDLYARVFDLESRLRAALERAETAEARGTGTTGEVA